MKHLGQFEPDKLTGALAQYPVEYFRVCQSTPGVYANLHWHYYNEMIYIESGRYNVLADGVLYRLQQGELLHIGPTRSHTTICPENESAQLQVLKFNSAMLRSSLGSEEEDKLTQPFCSKEQGSILHIPAQIAQKAATQEIFRQIQTEWETRPKGYPYAIKNQLCLLVLNLIRCGAVNPGKNMPHIRPKQNGLDSFFPVFEYIEKNYSAQIEISTLLTICNRSYSNFAVTFKKICGKTPKEYIQHVRIYYAKNMLEETQAPVAVVAEHCGFLDPSYFTRVFKAISGLSPREYRALCAEKTADR